MDLILHPTTTAQWHSLIHEAAGETGIKLSEDSASYLVFMLMRYTENAHLAQSVLSLDYLQSLQCPGAQRHSLLRDVGDKCLLLSGLFPGRALRKQVKVSYFVSLGQTAYWVLSDIMTSQLSEVYSGLSEDFVQLMDILQSFSSVKAKNPLSLLDAYDLWQETSSLSARDILQQQADFDYLMNTDDQDSKH